jgi:hypothetical protein
MPPTVSFGYRRCQREDLYHGNKRGMNLLFLALSVSCVVGAFTTMNRDDGGAPMRRGMQADQTLTATHDHTVAWAGLGADVSHIWYQTAVPASYFMERR